MKPIGIDLGTTNTVGAVSGKVFKTDAVSSAILPSVVAFPPDAARQVGSAARKRRPIDPQNTLFSTKRLIGRRWYSSEAEEFRDRYEFDIEKDPEDWPVFVTRAGKFSPTDVATMILEKVCMRSQVGLSKARGIVTVPSRFQESQREATREAALMAGLPVVHLLDEPIATAVASLTAAKENVRRAAVYDLGGGTFDVAVVDCTKPRLEILAHGGDLFLGGDDLDLGLAEWVAGQVIQEHNWDLKSETSVWARLVFECEQAKIRLTDNQETNIDLTRVDPSSPFADFQLTIGRPVLEKLVDKLIPKTFVLCDEVFRKAGYAQSQIDALFVAGGATQSPFVQKLIEQYFGKTVTYAYNPMYIVGVGASLAAIQVQE